MKKGGGRGRRGCGGCRRRDGVILGLRRQLAEVRGKLSEAQRSGKRQAAPFSKGPPKKDPKKPGRKAGSKYGPKAWRREPSRVDEVKEAPLPQACPHCRGPVEHVKTQKQYQTEIPKVQAKVIQFNVEMGRCRKCGKRVRGRHGDQVSNALGATGSGLGPRVLSEAAELNKGLGLSFEKVASLFERNFGLEVSRGGLCQALERVARRSEGTYQALQVMVRRSPTVAADETGWKVGGTLKWLWAFVGVGATVYTIREGRGYPEAAEVLGPDYSGVILRDGWAPYRKFEKARHQSCYFHLMRRCRVNLETAQRGAAKVPRKVLRLLENALALRDRRDGREISMHGLAVAVGRLESRLWRLFMTRTTDEENDKLLNHLFAEREAMFTFLRVKGVEACNWPGEQAIRPAVVTRKVCGGNRTPAGAHTQEVLMSVLRTCRQRSVDIHQALGQILRSPRPILPPALGLPAWAGPAPPS